MLTTTNAAGQPVEVHDCNADHDKAQWLALRAEDITSTEVAVLFNASPYMTLPELWQMKHDGSVLEIEENERMKWGTLLEPAIARGAAEEHGWEVAPFKQYMRRADIRCGSSFDYTGSKGDAAFLVEVKNLDYGRWKENWIDDAEGMQAPVHIELQAQHQMLVSGYKTAVIVALVGGNDLKVIPRAADEEVQAAMLRMIARFWESVDKHQAPALDFERDSAFILKKYRTVTPGKVFDATGTPGFTEKILAYRDMSEQEKDLKAKREGIKAEIFTRVQDHERVYGTGWTLNLAARKDGGRNFLISFPAQRGKKP